MLLKLGKTIDSMKGVYFGNLFGDESAFDLLFDLLSKKSLLNNKLDNYISKLNHASSEVCHILKDHFNNLTWRGNKKDEGKW